jgi:hypothetical protein
MPKQIAQHHKKAAKRDRAAHHTRRSRATRLARPKGPAAQEQIFGIAAVEEQALPPFGGQFFEAFEVEAEPPMIEVVELKDWQL